MDKVVINVHSANISEQRLSILYNRGFIFRSVLCGSIASVLEALKFENWETQREICRMSAEEARKVGEKQNWTVVNKFWWAMLRFGRYSTFHSDFINQLLWSVMEQDIDFKQALLATKYFNITYPALRVIQVSRSVVTEKEYCSRLDKMRKELREEWGLYP